MANRLTDIWKRMLIAVCHAHAAADQHVVADDLLVFDDRQQAKILGVYVNRIIKGKPEARLELARQVDFAIDRLGLRRRFLRVDGGAVKPNLMVGAGPRRQVAGDVRGQFLQSGVHRCRKRCRRRHHVALDIAAGAKRAQQTLVDARDGIL